MTHSKGATQDHTFAATANENTEVFEEEDQSSTDLAAKPYDSASIRITTKNFSIRELCTQIDDDDLDLAPEFQRSYVWPDKNKIRLIESVLLGIPLPVFYFNQDKTGAYQVIDGVQRLTTLKKFIDDEITLTKRDLEYLDDLDGLVFTSLDMANQRRFAKTQIVAHIIEPQTPDEVKYDIFNRVNTGGMPLKAQEIRHCMSKKKSRDLLKSLVEDPAFDKVMGNAFKRKTTGGEWKRDNKRMADREIALRFCAFYITPVDEYAKSSSLDAFLLRFTHSIDQTENAQAPISVDLDKMQAAFVQAMKNCQAILGEGAFRLWLPGQAPAKKFNRAIFESQAIALADYPLTQLMPHKEAIQNAFRDLFLDPDYDTAVRMGTASHSKVRRRLAMPQAALAAILTPSNKGS